MYDFFGDFIFDEAVAAVKTIKYKGFHYIDKSKYNDLVISPTAEFSYEHFTNIYKFNIGRTKYRLFVDEILNDKYNQAPKVNNNMKLKVRKGLVWKTLYSLPVDGTGDQELLLKRLIMEGIKKELMRQRHIVENQKIQKIK